MPITGLFYMDAMFAEHAIHNALVVLLLIYVSIKIKIYNFYRWFHASGITERYKSNEVETEQRKLVKQHYLEFARTGELRKSDVERMVGILWKIFTVLGNNMLLAWEKKKFNSLNNSRIKAGKLMEWIYKEMPALFVHWREGMFGALT